MRVRDLFWSTVCISVVLHSPDVNRPPLGDRCQNNEGIFNSVEGVHSHSSLQLYLVNKYSLPFITSRNVYHQTLHLCTHSSPHLISVHHLTWSELPELQDPLLTWMSEHENSSFIQGLGLPPGITDYDRFGWFYKVRLSPSFLPISPRTVGFFFVRSVVHALWFQ